MKLGLQINRFNFPGGDKSIRETLRQVAQESEKAGIDSLWVMDHFFQIRPEMLGPKQDPMMEAYTTLGFLAGVTERVTLGTMVTGVIYREPALLIKAVTALDVLSDGRAYFGIGAGWNEQEATALALPNPLTSQRFDRLEDTLQLAKQMWADDTSEFKGKLYNLPEPINHPNSIAKPHPPILIGGGGEQKTLKLVAQYGDACNLFYAAGGEVAQHKLDVLKKHCQDVGRDYDEIEKTALAGISIAQVANNPEKALETMRAMQQLGFSHAILSIGNEDDMSAYSKAAPIIEQIHNL
ncbi:MAG: LLM class F420-dependent oxidoreductase [Candidatus Saccharimonadales bacterium]